MIHLLRTLQEARLERIREENRPLTPLEPADEGLFDVRETVEGARRWAAYLEAENAAALALHHRVSCPWDEDYCDHDLKIWPCPTALALGVEADR